MLGELLKAIKLRWAVKSLGATFLGGIHEAQAPTGTAQPYVVLSLVGSSMTGRATSTTDNKFAQFETVVLDLTIHSKGGPSAASALAETLKTAFDNAAMTLSGGVTLKKFWYQGESVLDDPDHPNVKELTVTYQAELEQDKTLVPA